MTDPIMSIVIGVFVVGFILVPVLRTLNARRAQKANDLIGADAREHGIRHVTAPGALPGLGEVRAPASSAPAGAHVFSGTAQGFPWTAQLEARTDFEESRTHQGGTQRTRLTFPALTAARGTFVLAISLPQGVEVPESLTAGPGEGFLGKIAARAAEGLLDVFVGAYFGPEHRALVNVAGAARPAGPPGFFVLSTDPALAARLFDDQGRRLLAGLQSAVPGAALSLQASGVLVTDAGLHFGCMVGLTPASVLEAVAERVASVVAHGQPPRG